MKQLFLLLQLCDPTTQLRHARLASMKHLLFTLGHVEARPMLSSLVDETWKGLVADDGSPRPSERYLYYSEGRFQRALS